MEFCTSIDLFMEKYRLLLESGAELPLPVQGSSMTPFLVDRRDRVWVKKPEGPLHTGDIVLYQRTGGQYILHRIHSSRADCYTLVGDAHSVLEPGINRDQIFGKVTRVCRKGKELRPGSFCWTFFAHIWIHMVPLRPVCLRLYAGLKALRSSRQDRAPKP